jgi:hypothetical protein
VGGVTVVPLSIGREARLRVAVYDACDARGGDPDVFRARVAEVVDLHQRLCAEQLAEQGVIPETFGGCIAVLHVAAAILKVIGDDDAAA